MFEPRDPNGAVVTERAARPELRLGGDAVRGSDGQQGRAGWRQSRKRGQRTVVSRVGRGGMRTVIFGRRVLIVMMRMICVPGMRHGGHRNAVDRADIGHRHTAQVRCECCQHRHRCL